MARIPQSVGVFSHLNPDSSGGQAGRWLCDLHCKKSNSEHGLLEGRPPSQFCTVHLRHASTDNSAGQHAHTFGWTLLAARFCHAALSPLSGPQTKRTARFSGSWHLAPAARGSTAAGESWLWNWPSGMEGCPLFSFRSLPPSTS